MLNKYANPKRFSDLSIRILPWSGWITLIMITSGLYFSFWGSPPDYQQGQTVRIMYVHVPAAWMALFIYAFIAIFSGVGLIWKNPIAHIAASAAAPVGACYTLICIVTGSLWGKPIWGAWWVWDARLTSVLVLLFLYIGFIVLRNAFDDVRRGEQSSAILALIGAVNLPIIKFSVDWWNTLHQPASITKIGLPSIHTSMLIPLLLMASGFMALFVTLTIIRIRTEIASRKILSIRSIPNEKHRSNHT